MNKLKNSNGMRNITKVWRLNRICVVSLIIMMFLYLALTFYSSNQLAKQTEIIAEHPYEVTIAIGDLKTSVSQMQSNMERLLSHNSPQDVELIRTNIEALSADTAEPLATLDAQYLGDRADLQELETSLHRFQTEQNQCLDYAVREETTTDMIEEHVKEYLVPVYEELQDVMETTVNSARERKTHYGEQSNEMRKFTLIGSTLLVTLMLAILFLTQYIVNKQRRELTYRAAQIDTLSESIDDTFVIWDSGTGKETYRALNMKRVLGQEDSYIELLKEDSAEIKAALKEWDFAVPYTKTVQYLRPDGEQRWIAVRIYRAKDIAPVLYISVFTDCTDDIRSRQALQDAMLGAEKANYAKSEFLSRMSHEIRTPLNAIIGMTTIAASFIKDAVRVEDCLTKINFSSKHLLMLINDVLDMSKIESRKEVIHKESFDLFEIISHFTASTYQQAKAKGLQFECVLEQFGGQAQYIGDPLRLTQILLNLSSNALKFTPAGGKVELRVSKISYKGKTDIVRFMLSDTGIGMTPQELERCFEPFEQANASISARFGGTGLGMSITKNLVNLMGGRLEVKSEPDKGTTCIVELPLHLDETVAIVQDFSNQGLRALVVDDEQNVCEQTAALLENIKIESRWVMTGEEAVREVTSANKQGNDYDFCLIDWKIPDMNGIEITKLIRKSVGWGLPIVMVSAYDYSEIEEEARAAGVNAFLPKPLYRSAVYTTVKNTLNKESREDCVSVSQAGILKGRRLLVAEDNELNQEILVTLLGMSEIQSECASNGQDAIQMFAASEPGYYDAILMDVQMPVMNGLEAASKIRTLSRLDARTIPIIATTANAFGDDIAEAMAAGMDAHISKPIDVEQLCKVLAELISDVG